MKTVLIIEDDQALRENTAEILELSHYKVITASNGLIGVAMAKKHVPDIILCDIMMPKLDGYQVLNKLSNYRRTQYIPFVFLSVKGQVQDIRKGMNLGADDYIIKPYTEDDLLNVIERRIAKSAILLDSGKERNPISAVPINENIETLNDLKNHFEDYGMLFEFNKDDIIYTVGDHANHVYLLSEGTVKSYRINEQGKELITGLYKVDDLFGYTSFIHNIPHKETATAVEDIKLFAIPNSEFKEILNSNHKVVLEIIELLADNLSTLKEQLLQMAYSSVNEKTAASIIRFVENLSHKPGGTIKIPRSDLASAAGIASETFIRALTIFKNQGIIKADGKNFKVVDLDKLKKIK
jgi:CRP-like cAMP-binding protein/FixJ family two-component response regulator